MHFTSADANNRKQKHMLTSPASRRHACTQNRMTVIARTAGKGQKRMPAIPNPESEQPAKQTSTADDSHPGGLYEKHDDHDEHRFGIQACKPIG